MPCLVSMTDTRLFIFRFGCLEDITRTLSIHPHSIDKKKLYLARWVLGMVDIDLPKSAAIWVRLKKKIPFHLWSRNIILALASALGKPLRLDDITTSQRFLSYTRLLVEVNLSKALPTSIGMDIEGANPVNIPVEIEKLPCSTCLKPGHTTLSCHQTTGIRPITPTVDNPLPKLVPHPKPVEESILGPPFLPCRHCTWP